MGVTNERETLLIVTEVDSVVARVECTQILLWILRQEFRVSIQESEVAAYF